ncbi:MAG: amino acid ABC transporter ATP-binding protein [Bacteroidales bacterium]|nr:amino acid ABC transporter ATP-binding protein [Bacteroidales bacterium]
MIDVSHITKTFGSSRILDDVSLHIYRNETVSIIGYAGSGKSTLLNCMAGLTSIDSGSVTVNSTRKGTYNGMGMVFQEHNLFSHLTVLQNMTVAPVNVLGISKEEAEKQAMELLDTVGLWEKSSEYPDHLSLGQRQRVAIARSLMMNPDVLLLDEPTSSLDPVSSSEVMDVIRELKKKKMTIVMVTHRLDLAAEVSDRIAFMYNGQIYETGTADQIIYRPQNRVTRNYIDHCLNLVYEIHSSKYDYPELNARIENFCNRYKLGPQSVHSVQLVVEEFLNLVPLDEGVRLLVSKSVDNLHLNVDAWLPDSNRIYIDKSSLDEDLSYAILVGMCELIEESVDDSEGKHVHLQLKENVF